MIELLIALNPIDAQFISYHKYLMQIKC